MYFIAIRSFLRNRFHVEYLTFLMQPYADDPENSGLQVAELDDLTNMTTLSDKSGLQVVP